jgi:hypothetical protein
MGEEFFFVCILLLPQNPMLGLQECATIPDLGEEFLKREIIYY